MAVPVVMTVIKMALKRAVLKQFGGDAATSAALKTISSGKLTDAHALLLNRLKSKPSQALKNTIARELGLHNTEIEKIMAGYKQTAQMREAGLGDTFKRLAVKKLRTTFGLNRLDKIEDILRKMSDKTAETGGDANNSNTYVYALLSQLQAELDEKVKGALENDHGTQGGARLAVIDVNVMKYFNPAKDYTEKHEFNLEQLIASLTKDIEFYVKDSNLDVYILTGEGSAKVHSKAVINAYVSDVKSDVRSIMAAKGS